MDNSNSVISVSENICELLGFTLDNFLDGKVSLKDLIHSMGLGLSVSYGIIKNHGGDIAIDSEPNIGSTISLVFPRKRKK